jgi:uncharacterized protein
MDRVSDPGREQRKIKIATLASGYELSLALLLLKGSTAGPRVGISATIHGDETTGVQVVRELWRSLDPSQLSGTIAFMPVANPLGFESLSRNTPLDMLDLNRQFPGVRDGWFSEQLAAAIDEHFLRELDFYIDLHAGGTFPFVDYCYLLNDEGLSRAFLSELLYKPAHLYSGTSASVTVSRRVPTTVVELGGGYADDFKHVPRAVRGVSNMLRYMGCLPGTAERLQKQVLLHEIKVIRPRAGGLCIPEPSLRVGLILGKGAKLAQTISPYDFETLEELRAPFDQNIVVLCRNFVTRVNPGDYAFMIGDYSSAEILEE